MADDALISSDRGLAGPHRATLVSFAGTVIPASREYGVPGADDDVIAADLVASAAGSAEEIAAALTTVDALSSDEHGDAFANLDATARLAVATAFRHANRALAAPLIMLVAQCYYRDERVMAALGMEPRPPYPEGFEVEQGDWSLLDPVRRRAKMVREV